VKKIVVSRSNIIGARIRRDNGFSGECTLVQITEAAEPNLPFRAAAGLGSHADLMTNVHAIGHHPPLCLVVRAAEYNSALCFFCRTGPCGSTITFSLCVLVSFYCTISRRS
jgi:hypothetical protein